MRVVVTGATGNKGTSLLARLSADVRVEEVVGIARRVPSHQVPKVRWVGADVRSAELEPLFAGADAVVHLAWLIQPSHAETVTASVNVDGSERVFRAAARSGARALVYASSVGAYAPGPKDRAVGEEHPTTGIATSFYSRHKSEAERRLDAVEREHPGLRVVRLRPGIVLQRAAATEIRRLFLGPLLPSPLMHRRLIGVVPRVPRLRFQVVHADDVAAAYHLAVTDERARGAYNVAADPVLDPGTLAETLGARAVPMSARLLRAAADVTWRLHLQPTPPGWLDMALGVPVMDMARIRALGWEPRHSATDALLEILEGIRTGAGHPTPPLDPATSGRLRVRELLTGIGERSV